MIYEYTLYTEKTKTNNDAKIKFNDLKRRYQYDISEIKKNIRNENYEEASKIIKKLTEYIDGIISELGKLSKLGDDKLSSNMTDYVRRLIITLIFMTTSFDTSTIFESVSIKDKIIGGIDKYNTYKGSIRKKFNNFSQLARMNTSYLKDLKSGNNQTYINSLIRVCIKFKRQLLQLSSDIKSFGHFKEKEN